MQNSVVRQSGFYMHNSLAYSPAKILTRCGHHNYEGWTEGSNWNSRVGRQIPVDNFWAVIRVLLYLPQRRQQPKKWILTSIWGAENMGFHTRATEVMEFVITRKREERRKKEKGREKSLITWSHNRLYLTILQNRNTVITPSVKSKKRKKKTHKKRKKKNRSITSSWSTSEQKTLSSLLPHQTPASYPGVSMYNIYFSTLSQG